MKILLVHNFYGSGAPSGENTAFVAEQQLLRRHEHTVIEFTRHSDEIINRGVLGTVQGALATPWNPFSKRALRSILEKEKPDIMHVHNTFPLLSPSIFRATKDLSTATVLTLHNYRTFCAAGIPMRNSLPCSDCLDSESVAPALQYGCYRDSRLSTLPLAAMIALHRRVKTYEKFVDGFIVFSEFQKDRVTKAGLPAEKIYIKPPFRADPHDPLPWNERQEKVVFVGRLGVEKGVYTLVEAWKLWGKSAPKLEVIGDGPERPRLQAAVNGNGISDKVSFLGQLPFSEVQKYLGRARLLVLPSMCFEGYPMAVIEAFSLGVPVAVSDIGPLPDIVKDGENGMLFRTGDPISIWQTIREIWSQPERLRLLAEKARREFEKSYTAEINYQTLKAIYQDVIKRRGKKTRTEG